MSFDAMQPFSVSLHKVYLFSLLLSLPFLLWWHHFVVKSPDKAEGISLCVYTHVSLTCPKCLCPLYLYQSQSVSNAAIHRAKSSQLIPALLTQISTTMNSSCLFPIALSVETQV